MYAAVAAAIVWYRFITPIRQALRHQLRVEAVHRESPDVISIVIRGEHLDELQAEGGQFFRWRFLTRGMWWASQPYSLSAAPTTDRLRITVKALGDHSRRLPLVLPGTRVLAEGPYGALTAARRTRRKALLVAGGVGITPLRTLFQTLPVGSGDLTLVYRASNESDLVFRHELEQLADRRRAKVHFLTGRRTDLGYDPLSAPSLVANVPDLRHHDVFVCGPTGMAESVTKSLRSAGVPRRQIHHESFEF
jgi:ferredoxin-NADP reductase